MSTAYDSVQDVHHWVRIEVWTRLGGEKVQMLMWKELTWEVRVKWGWYFKYRTALLQVEYPRYFVEMFWGNCPKGNAEEIRLKNRIRAKKAKITEFKNKIQKAREDWKQLFPVEEHPHFIKAVEKLARLENELIELVSTSST